MTKPSRFTRHGIGASIIVATVNYALREDGIPFLTAFHESLEVISFHQRAVFGYLLSFVR